MDNSFECHNTPNLPLECLLSPQKATGGWFYPHWNLWFKQMRKLSKQKVVNNDYNSIDSSYNYLDFDEMKLISWWG